MLAGRKSKGNVQCVTLIKRANLERYADEAGSSFLLNLFPWSQHRLIRIQAAFIKSRQTEEAIDFIQLV